MLPLKTQFEFIYVTTILRYWAKIVQNEEETQEMKKNVMQNTMKKFRSQETIQRTRKIQE